MRAAPTGDGFQPIAHRSQAEQVIIKQAAAVDHQYNVENIVVTTADLLPAIRGETTKCRHINQQRELLQMSRKMRPVL